MNKTLLLLRTKSEIDTKPRGGIAKVVRSIAARAVRVVTPHFSGAAVVIGDKIITSSSLVCGNEMLKLVFSKGNSAFAVVKDVNYAVNLAKLQTVVDVPKNQAGGTLSIRESGPLAIGDPLILIRVEDRKTPEIGAMLYSTRLAHRFAGTNILRMHNSSLEGILGGAVWNIDGALAGVIIGRKVFPTSPRTNHALLMRIREKSPLFQSDDLNILLNNEPRLYGVPADKVLDYVETN